MANITRSPATRPGRRSQNRRIEIILFPRVRSLTKSSPAEKTGCRQDALQNPSASADYFPSNKEPF